MVVVERCNNNQGQAAERLKLSQPLISQVLSGTRNATPAFAIALAAETGISLDELFDVGPPPWSHLPGWDKAIAQGRALFPNVRTAAWKRVGAIREEPPAELDPAKLGLLASMFDKKVGDT